MSRLSLFPTLLAIGLAAFCLAATSDAQEGAQPLEKAIGQGQAFDLPEGLGGMDSFGGFGGDEGAELILSAKLRAEKGSRKGVIEVKAVLASHWHTYALDQQGGPGPSKITFKSAEKAEVLGAFRPDHEPKVRKVEFFDEPLREHHEQVVWSAPVRLAEGVDPETSQLEVQFDGQICNDSVGCKPIFGKTIQVAFGGYYGPTTAASEYRLDRSHATLGGHIEPSVVAPGCTVQLLVTAVSDAGWHIYAHAPEDPDGISKPTLIAVAEPSSWSVGSTVASSEPVVKELIAGEPPVQYHDGSITWTTEIEVPEDVEAGEYELSGIIGYQTCADQSCDRPMAAQFAVMLTVGDSITDDQQPLTFEPSRYGEAARLAANRAMPMKDVAVAIPSSQRLDLNKLEIGGDEETSTAMILAMAFAAGFILNFMPCVLPVIGLKIMAFVQQAGDSRVRVFMLNLWYGLGVMAVFMVLATLAVGFGMKWADQFTSATFNVVLTSIVFAFALSLLGVWEIPIPGFVGSGKAQELAEKEGATAAFLKGILATVLATPCAGPLIVPAIAWAVKQPPLVAYGGFACVGFGMASPYLFIGLFPQIISFLPKPGAWMETFKHIMGFILLGTVVWLLTFIPIPHVIPAVAFVMGLWAAFWWIGRTSLTEPFLRKLRAWIGGVAFATLIGLFAFVWLHDVMKSRFQRAVDRELAGRNVAVAAPEPTGGDEGSHELPWQPYSLALLEDVTAEGKTVFVDFTADW